MLVKGNWKYHRTMKTQPPYLDIYWLKTAGTFCILTMYANSFFDDEICQLKGKCQMKRTTEAFEMHLVVRDHNVSFEWGKYQQHIHIIQAARLYTRQL